MTDSRHEIHDGLTQAADDIVADKFDDAIKVMTQLHNGYTIPPLPSLLDRARQMKRNKDRTAEEKDELASDLRRVGVEMGP